MLDSARGLAAGQTFAADVVVVGAGAVGLCLAASLATAGVDTVLLEAGPMYPPSDYQNLNGGLSSGRPYRGVRNGRLKAWGGTTRLWGGQLVEFSRQDFEGNAAAGRPAWPIPYDEVAPHFENVRRLLGITVSAEQREAVRTKLQDCIGGHLSDLEIGLNIWTPNPDLGKLFERQARSLRSLRALTDAPVSSLRFSTDGMHVTDVTVVTQEGRALQVQAQHVVLACGTIEIAKRLLVAASVAPHCGFARNRRIGAGFVDHLHGIAGEIAVADYRRTSNLFDNVYINKVKHTVKLRAADDLLRADGILNCAATLNCRQSIGNQARDFASLLRRVFSSDADAGAGKALTEAISLLKIMPPLVWRYLVEGRSTSFFKGGAFLGVELEQLPHDGSYIALQSGGDPQQAEVVVNWPIDGKEMEGLANFCKQVKEQLEVRGLATVQLDPRILARDPAFLDDCHDSYHQIGGARMGCSESDGVVDRNLLVFGTDNLYVCGAATFPSGSFANPTLTAMALALRLSEHLKSRIEG